ncbi:MAG: DUF2274 domain-containing protein [Giesbergeria sp.]
MSKPTNQLKLGPLPKIVLTKITFACTTDLQTELDRYAALHSQTHGEPVNAVALIPHMLEAFMAQDRVFKVAQPKVLQRR